MSYDPKFAQAAADRIQEQMGAKCNPTTYPGGAIGAADSISRNSISGIQIQFLANGFLVSPSMDYLGPSNRQIAHVARDKDELLKLVGEMLDAHAS